MSNTVPKEWQIKTVDEVATVFAGGTPSRSNPDYYEGTIPWVKSGEVNSRLIYRTEETISELAVKESSARWAKRGSVLVAMYGATAGKAARLMIDATLNQAVSAINGRENTADNWFLLYAIENNTRELLNTVQGSGQPNLSGQLIKTLNLPIPPLPEQQKIAAILSSVDDVIEKTRAQIDKLKDLKTGMMQELLTKGIGSGGVPHTEFKDSPVGRIPTTWNVLPLEQLVRSDRNITYGIVQAGPHHEEGVPYIRVSDMTRRHLSLDGMLRTSPEIAQKYKRSSVSAGDIVYALRGVIGHVHLVPAELDGANLTQGTARLSPNDSVHSRYMLWAMKSPAVQLQNDLEAKGSTFKEVTLASLRKIQITLPPAEEQVKITSVLDSIERKLHGSEDKFEHLQRLKKALMQDLLTGKVRVKADQKESAVA